MWTAGTAAALVLSTGVGLLLGMVGGGGSIVTVPILVYVAGMSPGQAVALSLPIVGTTAAVGACIHYRAGNADLRAASAFAAAGIVGAPAGAQLTRLLPGPVLLVLFALLMLAVGVRMLRGQWSESDTGGRCRLAPCGIAGLGLGVLTGFLGVGGGFLIVPALLRFARTPMRKAIGTSLFIIAVNSAAGFTAHLGDVHGAGPLAAALTVSALVGLVAGISAGRKLQTAGLRTAFGGVALLVAAYLLAMNVGAVVELAARNG